MGQEGKFAVRHWPAHHWFQVCTERFRVRVEMGQEGKFGREMPCYMWLSPNHTTAVKTTFLPVYPKHQNSDPVYFSGYPCRSAFTFSPQHLETSVLLRSSWQGSFHSGFATFCHETRRRYSIQHSSSPLSILFYFFKKFPCISFSVFTTIFFYEYKMIALNLICWEFDKFQSLTNYHFIKLYLVCLLEGPKHDKFISWTYHLYLPICKKGTACKPLLWTHTLDNPHCLQ